MKVRSAGALRNQGAAGVTRSTGQYRTLLNNKVTWGVRAIDTELLCMHLGPDMGVYVLM